MDSTYAPVAHKPPPVVPPVDTRRSFVPATHSLDFYHRIPVTPTTVPMAVPPHQNLFEIITGMISRLGQDMFYNILQDQLADCKVSDLQ